MKKFTLIGLLFTSVFVYATVFTVQIRRCPEGQTYKIYYEANSTSRPESKCVDKDEKK